MTAATRTRVVLCGTNYGASYLPALDHPSSPFVLAGILAKGSERSTRLVAAKNVVLWTRPEEVARDVAAAIVALPPPASGVVARQLIERGIHVLSEHPLTAAVLEELRRASSAAKVVHHVNGHFGEMTAPRAFAAECRKRIEAGPPQWVSVVTAARTAYATFDLLGRAMGGLAATRLERTSTPSDGFPFATFAGTVRGVPLRVACSAGGDSVDDGSDSPVPMRIEVGFRDGQLLQLGPVGPVVWSEVLRLALRAHPGPVWTPVFDRSMTFGEVMADRIGANLRALDDFHAQIEGSNEPLHQATEWLTVVAELMRVVRESETLGGLQ